MKTITLPLADVRALVKLAWEQTRHIEATDQSATGSIYGIEYADKTIARVAAKLPEPGCDNCDSWRPAEGALRPARQGTCQTTNAPTDALHSCGNWQQETEHGR